MKKFTWRSSRWEGKAVNSRRFSLTQDEIQEFRTLLLRESEVESQQESNVEQCFLQDAFSLKNEVQCNAEEYSKDVIRNSAPVLSVLFSKMDLETLKNSRRACYRWYKESMFEFVKRRKVVLRLESDSSDQTLSLLLTMKDQIFNSPEGCHIQDLPIENIGSFFSGRYFQPVVVNRISSLSFVFSDQEQGTVSAREIALIMCSCLNLNDLHFTNIPTVTAANLCQEIRFVHSMNEISAVNIHFHLSEILSLRLTENIYRGDHYDAFLSQWFKSMSKLKGIELNIDLDNSLQGKCMSIYFFESFDSANDLRFLKRVEELKFQKRDFDHLFHWVFLTYLRSNFCNLKKVEIGYMEEWRENQSRFQPSDQSCPTHALSVLMCTFQETLEIFRISLPFDPPELNTSLWRPTIRMKKLKILEIDWNGLSSVQEEPFVGIPNWEHCKFIYPKCNYRNVDYFTKVEFKVKSSENSASSCKYILKTLEYKSPELLTEIISTVLLRKGNEFCTVISVDLRQNKLDTLVNFLLDISKTNIEEISVSAGCNIESDEENGCTGICTLAEYLELEDKSYTYLWFQNNTVEQRTGSSDFFQKLKKFELISFGCGKIDVSFLGNVGILQRIKCSPVRI